LIIIFIDYKRAALTQEISAIMGLVPDAPLQRRFVLRICQFEAGTGRA